MSARQAKRMAGIAAAALVCLGGSTGRAGPIQEREAALAADPGLLAPFTPENAGRIGGFSFAAARARNGLSIRIAGDAGIRAALAPTWPRAELEARLADPRAGSDLASAAILRLTTLEWRQKLAQAISRLEHQLAWQFDLPLELVYEESDFIRAPETFRALGPFARRTRAFAPLGLEFMDAYLRELEWTMPRAAKTIEQRMHAELLDYDVRSNPLPEERWRMAYFAPGALPHEQGPGRVTPEGYVAGDRLTVLRFARFRRGLMGAPSFFAHRLALSSDFACRAFDAPL